MGLTFAFGRGGTRPPSVTPDIEAPSAPTGLTASSVTQTTLTLTWSASTDNVGVVGYDVYNGAILAETVTDLTAFITGLIANTQYNFTVRAKDAAGNISEPSNVETVTTLEPIVDDSIYIDPTNSASGRNGSIENPYNSFVDSGIANGNTYKVKAGTVLTTSSVLDFSNRTDVTVTTYGVGVKPRLYYNTGGTCAVRFANSTNCTLLDLEIETNIANSVIAIIQMGEGTGTNGGTGNIIAGCKIHGVKQSNTTGGIGIRGGGTDLHIVNCEIYDCADDGMYLRDTTNVNVGYCNIYQVCQNYAGLAKGFANAGGSSGGDCIQFNGRYINYYVHHTIMDRTDEWTGNKYCLITAQAAGQPAQDGGIIEHCTFKTKSTVLGAVFFSHSLNTIVRFNYFDGCSGTTEGVFKLANGTCQNTLIHHNIFDSIPGRAITIGYNSTLLSATGTKIYNNVFYKQLIASSHNGCIWNDHSNIEVRNNIFHFDGVNGVALFNFNSGVFTITHNCFDDVTKVGTPGQGTNAIIADPLFIDAANDDFHLQAASSCRNSGIDVGLIEDYYGITVPQEALPAIGVAEYNIV